MEGHSSISFTGGLQTTRSLVKEIEARKVMHDAGLGGGKLSGGGGNVIEFINLYRKPIVQSVMKPHSLMTFIRPK